MCLCMGMHARTHARTYVRTCMLLLYAYLPVHMLAEAKGEHCVSCSITSTLFPEAGPLTEPEAHHSDWAGWRLRSEVCLSPYPSAGIISRKSDASLSLGPGYWDVGPYAYRIGTLTFFPAQGTCIFIDSSGNT